MKTQTSWKTQGGGGLLGTLIAVVVTGLVLTVLITVIRSIFMFSMGPGVTVKETYYQIGDGPQLEYDIDKRVRVPLVPGNTYTWRQDFEAESKRIDVSITEITRGLGEITEEDVKSVGEFAKVHDVKKTKDGLSYTVKMEMQPEWKNQGWVGGTIELDKKDGIGRHRIQIDFPGGQKREIVFEIVKPKETKKQKKAKRIRAKGNPVASDPQSQGDRKIISRFSYKGKFSELTIPKGIVDQFTIRESTRKGSSHDRKPPDYSCAYKKLVDFKEGDHVIVYFDGDAKSKLEKELTEIDKSRAFFEYSNGKLIRKNGRKTPDFKVPDIVRKRLPICVLEIDISHYRGFYKRGGSIFARVKAVKKEKDKKGGLFYKKGDDSLKIVFSDSRSEDSRYTELASVSCHSVRPRYKEEVFDLTLLDLHATLNLKNVFCPPSK